MYPHQMVTIRVKYVFIGLISPVCVYLIAGDLLGVSLDGLDDFSGTHGTPLVIHTTLVHTQQFLHMNLTSRA